MEFKKLPRSCWIESGWRLATVEEAQKNVESIKHRLEKWDRARLLDGWMGGSTEAYDFNPQVGFKSCVGYMLLVKSPQADCKYRYSGIRLSEEGMSAALFLCTEDWNYEVVCWLLKCWSKDKIEQIIPLELIEENGLVHASKQVSALATVMEFVHSQIRVPKSRFSATSMRVIVSQFLNIVTHMTNEHSSLRNVLSSIDPIKVANEYWRQMHLTEDMESFQNVGFRTEVEGTSQALADAVFHFVTDAMVVRIVRDWVNREVEVSVNCIVHYANKLLNRIFFEEDALGRAVQEAADTAKGDLELFKESLRDSGYGTFHSNGRYSFLSTVLVQASKSGDVTMVKQLIDIGLPPFESDDAKERTSLHYAAKCDNEADGYKLVEMLLRGPKTEILVNVRDYKERTALHGAAFCGYGRICKLLIEHKAGVSIQDKFGQIPLHYALRREHQNEDVIKVLISEDSSSVDVVDSYGRNPLSYAVEYQGNNVSMMTNLLVPHFKQKDLASYLREASRRGHVDLVKMLVKGAASLLDRDENGKTALHCAAEGKDDQQALDISYQLLLDEYNKVSNFDLARACDKHGKTVLHVAASSGHRKLCEWLLSLTVIEVDRKDRNGRSALYDAVQCKDDNAQLLDVWWRRRSPRQAFKMVDLKDFRDITPLHVAAEKGNYKMVEKILSRGTTQDRKTLVGASNVFGQTALHKAASGGHAHVVGKLLSEGAHPLTERDCDGKTALHYAVEAKNIDAAEEIAMLLLESCHCEKVKFLLLNAFALGTGFAEESDGCNSSLEKYLLEEKNKLRKTTDQTENLHRVADILNDEQMAKELLSQGINIEHIRSYEFREPRDKQNFHTVEDEIDNISNLLEEDTDKPALHDNLGRTAFVNGLASLFLNPSVSSPITVGICGEWGMGKSSVMVQVEAILLKAAAHLAVSSSLRTKDIPGTSNSNSFRFGEAKCGKIISIVEYFVKRLFYTAKNLMKVLSSTNENNIDKSHGKVLRSILGTYQHDSHQVFKSLAVAKRRNMLQIGKTKEEQESIRHDKIPSILTVRYNAWQYRSQTEAWAGLGVEIIKELEAAMTVAQRLSSSWRYNWASRKRTLCVEVFLPCFLAVIVALWVTVIIWFLLDAVKGKHSKDFKYASLPITLVAVSWAAVKSVMSVVKPISSTVVDYLCFPDHSKKLGYHQKVIDDINFLKKELGHKPSRIWIFYALIWCWTPFCSWESYVPKTTIPKMIPASQENLRMVVFVDDLDRCHENVILEILSAINLVLSVCEINVVMATDKRLIESAIERKFGNKQNKFDKSGADLADKYLRKIIQLPLDLPDPSPSDYNIFLQRQLGVLAIKEMATHYEEVTRKFNPKARKATFNSRISGRGKSTTSFEETGIRKRRDHTSDMAGEVENITEVSVTEDRQIPGIESTNITIHKGTDNEVPAKREEYNGGHKSWVHTCVKKLTSFLVCNQQENTDCEQDWIKFFSTTISTTIDFEILKRKYSPAERDAFCFLHNQVTGSRKLPREWKRLKNYHRLTWSILYKCTEVKTLRGWQVQLIAWVFFCWQWKDQINTLIQSWHELSVFEEDDPWLRDIVEHYIDERWPPPPRKIDSLAQATINTRVKKAAESESSETMSKEEDTQRKDYLKEEVRKLLKEMRKKKRRSFLKVKALEARRSPQEQELTDWVEIVHNVIQQESNWQKTKNKESTGKSKEVDGEEASVEQARMSKDKDEQKNKASEKITGKAKVAKVDKEEEEHKEWINLRETLKRYDVSIKSILVFQDFRFYCVPRNLGWQLPSLKKKIPEKIIT